MFELLANSALTWDVYFSSGAALVFLVVFAFINVIKIGISYEEGDDIGIALSCISVLVAVLCILLLTIYTNAYQSGVTDAIPQ